MSRLYELWMSLLLRLGIYRECEGCDLCNSTWKDID